MQPFGSDIVREAHITFIGHATTLIEMSGVRILTDPVFRYQFRFLKRRTDVSPSAIDLGNLDAVVLSHMHFDHMDYPSLRMIPRHVPIIAPAGAGHYLKGRIGHDVVEMREGEEFPVGPVGIHATPSVHESGFYWPFWYPKTVLSYVFVGAQTVHFIGDTALFDSMKEIGEQFDIDAALLPVWGFGPYLRGDHMSPREAAAALGMLAPRVAVPIHWGTLHPVGPWFRKMAFLQDPPRAFAYEAAQSSPTTEVRILAPGSHTTITDEPAYQYEREELPATVPVIEPAFA